MPRNYQILTTPWTCFLRSIDLIDLIGFLETRVFKFAIERPGRTQLRFVLLKAELVIAEGGNMVWVGGRDQT